MGGALLTAGSPLARHSVTVSFRFLDWGIAGVPLAEIDSSTLFGAIGTFGFPARLGSDPPARMAGLNPWRQLCMGSSISSA